MPKCSRCGNDAPLLHFIPGKVARVTHKLKHGEWSCDGCLTPEERQVIAKERWLTKIRRPEATPTVVPEEVDWAWEYAAEFQCPRHWDPTRCDGHTCPLKPDNPLEDYYNDCREYLKALMLLDKVMQGKIYVTHQSRGAVKVRLT